MAKKTAPSEVKETNPKDLVGSDKLPLHLWPTTATAMGCLALLDGALKYGRSNFRAVGVRASIYVDAAKRHLDAWFEGEEADPDSGLPHLAHALACSAILVEAIAKGNLSDDRAYPTRYREFVASLTPHVARLKQLRAGCSPRHYTIAEEATADVNVVVGVIVRGKSVLLQRRALGDENFGSYWECPGGGVEPGENDGQALARELREELGIALRRYRPEPIWRGSIEGYAGKSFSFRFYLVEEYEGRARPLDGQPNMGWFGSKESTRMALTPANLLAWPSVRAVIEGA